MPPDNADHPSPPLRLLPYLEVRRRWIVHPLLAAEIPSGFVLSPPLPTKKWGGCAYVFSAAPCRRVPGKPLEQAPPDRWWLVSAETGHLLTYSLCSHRPFVPEQWPVITWPNRENSIAELRKVQKEFHEQMNAVAENFFRGNVIDSITHRTFVERLASIVPTTAMLQHRSLAPDFFEWIDRHA